MNYIEANSIVKSYFDGSRGLNIVFWATRFEEPKSLNMIEDEAIKLVIILKCIFRNELGSFLKVV